MLEAQDTIAPPSRYTSRKRARSGPMGLEWVEDWILPRKVRTVQTEMAVGTGGELFRQVPGLKEALEARGLLVGLPIPAPVPEAADTGSARTDTGLGSSVSMADTGQPPDPGPGAPQRVAAEAPPTSLDSGSAAKTYVYEAQVTGSLSPAAVDLATEPLVPRIAGCYRTRQAEIPTLGGNAFLSALVGGDGQLVSTSVYGSVSDPDLMRCLEGVVEAWRFEAWGPSEAVSDVAVPIVFRVEDPPPRGRRPR